MASTAETVRCFRNALLLKDGAFVKDDLWVRNGKVIDPRDRFFYERKAVSIRERIDRDNERYGRDGGEENKERERERGIEEAIGAKTREFFFDPHRVLRETMEQREEERHDDKGRELKGRVKKGKELKGRVKAAQQQTCNTS